MDPRFAHLQSDPRFKKIGKKKKKVKIDNRFKHMFTAEQFSSVDFMDKRGRKEKEVTKEKLEKFYELSSSDDEEVEVVVPSPKNKQKKKKTKPEVEKPDKDSENESVEASDSEHSDNDQKVSSSEISDSSDGESSEDEREGGVEPDAWDEVNNCTETTEESTCRLSICNLNWDRMTATDIFVLLHSVLESKGEVHKVQIFPSQYGKDRMAKEQVSGPAIDEDAGDDKEYNADTLRRYQIERLRYYYAIVTCDSIPTADIVYKALDGVEYQLSSSILDLRYVPDDMTFDENPASSVCTSLPDLSTYKPPRFVTTALQNSSVKLTWDETDQSRLELTTKKYTANDLETVDFSAYIASSESESEKEEEERGGPSIEKYKALLAGIEEADQDQHIDQEMEITWTSGLEGNDKMTEEAEKNEERQRAQYKPDENDDFFATDEVIEPPSSVKQQKKRKKGKGADTMTPEAAELALLMGADEDERKHFNMKKIIKSKKEDDFKIDLEDDRFGALKTSHMYAIDPSAPEYKDTPATSSLRGAQAAALHHKENATNNIIKDHSTQSLVDKIKSKSSAFQSKKENSKLFKTKNKGPITNEQKPHKISTEIENLEMPVKKAKKKKRKTESEDESFVKPKKLKKKKSKPEVEI